VIDRLGFALYMSREPIPTTAKAPFGEIAAYKQVCVIPFTYACLARFAALAPTPLEITESIDMLRFLENGVRVRMVETEIACQSVDRPADLERVAHMMRGLT
jgi:3-deoxy-manno-octulosonate cytidylyltransferase (CMP-KDO synthetase)